MAGLIGTIGPFMEDESWEAYVERLVLYFQVNGIADVKRLRLVERHFNNVLMCCPLLSEAPGHCRTISIDNEVSS